MTHLVKEHVTGEYCLSDDDPSSITKKCEDCGDTDKILLSWDDEKRTETFEEYFSGIKKDGKTIISYCRANDITKQDMINIVNYSYNEDRNMISVLFEQDIITQGELRRLNIISRQAEIKQLVIVNECFKYHSMPRVVNYKNNMLLKKTRK